MAGAKLYVGQTDNVLGENDWPITLLEFDEGGYCYKQTVIKEGVYSAILNIKDLSELQTALDVDPTGKHPETYTILLAGPFFLR